MSSIKAAVTPVVKTKLGRYAVSGPTPTPLSSSYRENTLPRLHHNPVRSHSVRPHREAALRAKLAFWVDTSKSGRAWELLELLVATLFVSIYIWNTRYVKLENIKQALPLPFKVIELTLAILMLVLYLPRAVIAPSPFTFLVKPESVIVFLSTVPVFIAFTLSTFNWPSYIDEDLNHTYMSAGLLVYVYPFRFVHLNYTFDKCLVPVKNSLINLSPIARKGLQLGSGIFFTLLTVSAFIHIVSYKQHVDKNPKFELKFWDTFYFTTVSSTTGMRTDLVPENSFTRMVILYVMISGAIFIPSRLSELLTLMRLKSKYDHSYKEKKGTEHVLVAGNLEVNSLLEFLREFFCEDHGWDIVNTKVVILNPDEPAEDLALLLADPAFATRVAYVKGSATSFHSLDKAKLYNARAAFLLSSKYTTDDVEKEDAQQMLRALAMKKYNRNLKLYAQVHLPENISHFDFLAKDAICVDEFNLGILAQSAMMPGFGSLLMLLTTSLTDSICEKMIEDTKRRPDLAWIKDYLTGATNEIYSVQFSPYFQNRTFLQAAEIIYRHCGAMLFALGCTSKYASFDAKIFGSVNSGFRVRLNPNGHILSGDEIGFVIGGSSKIKDVVANFGRTEKHASEAESLLESGLLGSSEYFGYQATSETLSLQASNSTLGKDVKGVNDGENVDGAQDGPTATPYDEDHLQISTPGRSALVYMANDSAVNSDNEDASDGPAEDATDNAPLSALPPYVRQDPTSAPPSRSGSTAVSLKDQREQREQLFGHNVQLAKQLAALSPYPCLPTQIGDHIMICDVSALFPRNLEFFIACVRGKEPERNIVILSPADPDAETMARLDKFKQVFVIKGIATSRKDLYRAGIDRANKCVVLSDKKAYFHSSSETADATVLLAALNIEAMSNESNFILLECVQKETFKMVGESDTVHSPEAFAQALVRPSFMSGNVYAPSMLDSFICQCYYNSRLRSVLQQFIFSHNTDSTPSSTTFSSILGNLAHFTSEPVSELNDDDEQCDIGSEEGGHVWQADIPSRLAGKPYSELVTFLIRAHKALPLGLYRPVIHKGFPTHFVFINPSRTTLLIKGDRVYVIAKLQPVLQ